MKGEVTGAAASRYEGRAKVTGAATYSAEFKFANLLYAAIVPSRIAKGKITNIDAGEVERMPGVVKVYTHLNLPKIYNPSNDFVNSKIYEGRLPLSDAVVHYGGQIVAVVVADTFEHARAGAAALKVTYAEEKASVDSSKAEYKTAPGAFGEGPEFKTGQFEKGTFAEAAKAAPVKVEATYRTANELHAPMEPHAIIAEWADAESVTIHEHTQWVAGSQRAYAEMFGVATEKVRIVSPYIGGGFGSKALPWPHAIACVAAARGVNRPVKLVLSRRQMTANAGHRSETEQTVRLAAEADGKLVAIAHEGRCVTSPVEVFTENGTGVTPTMYAAPNLLTALDLAVQNVPTPTFMRAPGETPGMFALECAMDELAWQLKMDPVKLRILNETKSHQRSGLPFSAKAFKECLETGAEKFGWAKRTPQVRSMTRDGLLVGWGMAASTFPGARSGASAKVRLLPDGTCQVLTAANDMGTGAYTMVAITAAQSLGLPIEKIKVEFGDSRLPDGGLAGGSMMTATLAPAVAGACKKLLAQAKAENVEAALATLRKSGKAALEATDTAFPGEEGKKWHFQSWGAQFCEVTVDEAIGRVRVTRFVSVMNIGKVINPKTAASQVRGGVAMGLGAALMEEGAWDKNTGMPVVYDLAGYHFPTHADVPHIDVFFVGEPDLNFNPVGARGVGEIGITGVTAAVANAIYHATGKRLRDLPLTPDKLIGA